MFAFAVWDRHERRLTLARDRFGEKPLYYARLGRTFIFGSELKALCAHPGFSPEVDLASVALFLRHSCIPAPYSIYRDVAKLPPGTLLRISANDFNSAPKRYWSLHDVVCEAISDPLRCSEHETIEQLDHLLRDAVRIRMRSDVPLGAFLSGGIDSSAVVSLMQAQSHARVRTFSIGNHDRELNEAGEASTVARHLGTDHTELYVTSEQAIEIIPSLSRIYDEPFADCSQIPTILVSQLARKHVTVSLSGDGGDELFGGYNRHIWAGTLHRRLHLCPRPLRVITARGIRTVPSHAWDSAFRACQSLTPVRSRHRMPGYKLHKLASIIESRDVHTLYEKLASHWLDPSEILSGAPELRTVKNHPSFGHAAEEMMYLDTVRYLPDDILVKLDRATMSVSLEGRVPMLDPRVAQFAWRLPLHMRIRERQGKWILRQVLYRYVPREIVDRPKSGFGVPIAAWLRGPLRHWAESLLDERRLRQDGYFRDEPVRRMWSEHLSGKASWEYHLWDILMFQTWLDESHRAPSDPLASYHNAPTTVEST
jgi:asparagine synthase (glutamine-hydrolysing)